MMRTKARWTQRQNGSRVRVQNQNRRGRCAIAKLVHQVLQMQSEGHCQGVIQVFRSTARFAELHKDTALKGIMDNLNQAWSVQ